MTTAPLLRATGPFCSIPTPVPRSGGQGADGGATPETGMGRGLLRSVACMGAAAWMVTTAMMTGGCDKSITDKDITTTSYMEVQRLLDEGKTKENATLVLLMDPRSQAEFDRAHLPGAVNIKIEDFPSNMRESRQGRIPEFERFENLVVYGNDPGSTVARGMVKRLLANDYRSVYWFQGGLREWIAAGGGIEGSAATSR